MNINILVNCTQIPSTVQYTLTGTHYPATHTTPAEYPEVTITHLVMAGIDATQLLDNSELHNDIANQILGELGL